MCVCFNIGYTLSYNFISRSVLRLYLSRLSSPPYRFYTVGLTKIENS